jgi:hypothetical protein
MSKTQKAKITNSCANCFKEESEGVTFPKCGGCGSIRYCSKGCQKLHWTVGGHKHECNFTPKSKTQSSPSSTGIGGGGGGGALVVRNNHGYILSDDLGQFLKTIIAEHYGDLNKSYSDAFLRIGMKHGCMILDSNKTFKESGIIGDYKTFANNYMKGLIPSESVDFKFMFQYYTIDEFIAEFQNRLGLDRPLVNHVVSMISKSSNFSACVFGIIDIELKEFYAFRGIFAQ